MAKRWVALRLADYFICIYYPDFIKYHQQTSYGVLRSSLNWLNPCYEIFTFLLLYLLFNKMKTARPCVFVLMGNKWVSLVAPSNSHSNATRQRLTSILQFLDGQVRLDFVSISQPLNWPPSLLFSSWHVRVLNPRTWRSTNRWNSSQRSVGTIMVVYYPRRKPE